MPYDDPSSWPIPAIKYAEHKANKTDLDRLTELADQELGLSEVQLILLPRKTSLALDVIRACKPDSITQIGTFIWTTMCALATLAAFATGFGEMGIIFAATWVSMMCILWGKPVGNAWWEAQAKLLEAKEAEDVRRSHREKMGIQEENSRRLVGVEVFSENLLRQPVEQGCEIGAVSRACSRR